MSDEPGIQIANDYGTFGMIPTRLLRSNLSPNAKVLYALLWDYAARATQQAWPSRRTLAADLGRSVDRVDVAVKELVAFGALRVEARARPDGGQTSNLYRLLSLDPLRADTPTPLRADTAPPSALTRHQEQEPENENQRTKDVGTPPSTPGAEHSERLCILLADLIEANGSKRPTVTKKWLDAARLAIDLDGRSPQDVEGAIRWSQRDGFWMGNIMSMPTLREKFDRLRLEAERQRASGSGKNPAVAVAAGQSLVARLEARQHAMIEA